MITIFTAPDAESSLSFITISMLHLYKGSQQHKELPHSAIHTTAGGGEIAPTAGCHHSVEGHWLHLHC